MKSKNLAMVTALKEEEIELELGLSIGGSYRRRNGIELESDSHIDDGSKEKNPTCERSSISPSFMVDAGQEKDQKTKREIHALRRQEAKKRREEKQLKRGFYKENFNNIYGNDKNNEMILKGNDFQAKEREGDVEEAECKKIKKEENGSDHNDSKEANLNLAEKQNNDVNCNVGTCYPTTCTSSPVLPVHYPHPTMTHGMPANGFVYPCANVNVVPCWFTSGGGTAAMEERNAVQVQPLFSYGFVPFQAASGRSYNLGNGYDSEQNCSSQDRGKAGFNGSSKCTSSTVTDHRTSSREGGGSSSISYTRSHSSPSVPEQPQSDHSRANDVNSHSEHNAPSYLTKTAPVQQVTNPVEKPIPSNSSQSCPTGNKNEAKSETDSYPTEKGNSTPENPTSNASMESEGRIGKPSKPLTKNDSATPPLPYMPCVSTTGNGPNGKTINGFLYRYTKTEVSIICVCHGSSFTPAEFVQHAGGTDVSHPLRHITVTPSPF